MRHKRALRETDLISRSQPLAFRGLLTGLHTANLSWQTRVGKLKLVCVNGIKTVGKHVFI